MFHAALTISYLPQGLVCLEEEQVDSRAFKGVPLQ